MKKSILYSLWILFGSGLQLSAQKPAIVVSDKDGWHKITEVVANFEKDIDEVDVMLADKFAKLRFKVTDAAIELIDLDVMYEDETSQNITISYKIKKAGDTSPVIDIKGGEEKKIDHIVFRYRTVDNQKNKKAHVEIWGKKTNPDKKDGNKGAKKENRKSDNSK
jgi:hypothetical protein